MSARRRGTTLIEILITMGIFSLMMCVICYIFKQGLHFYQKGSSDVHTFQSAVIALDRMSRELQDTTSTELYFPAPEDIMAPKSSKGIVFVKELPDAGTFEVIGYLVDEERNELVRVVYDPGYDPEDSATQRESSTPGSRRTLARNILSLTFQGEDKGLLMTELTLQTKSDNYLRTKIRNEAIIK